jgi:hypothetical protein
MVIRTFADIDKFLLALLCILAVFDRTHSPLLSSYNLYALTIRESHLVVRNAEDTMSVGLNASDLLGYRYRF